MSWFLQEAKQQLLVMVGVLRQLDVGRKGGHTAAADMAYLYAMTQVWFTVERNYKVCMLLPATACTPIPRACGWLSALPQHMLPFTAYDPPAYQHHWSAPMLCTIQIVATAHKERQSIPCTYAVNSY